MSMTCIHQPWTYLPGDDSHSPEKSSVAKWHSLGVIETPDISHLSGKIDQHDHQHQY